MRVLLAIAAIVLAGCTTGPSDTARAWCNDNFDAVVSYATRHGMHFGTDAEWDRACAEAFSHGP